MFLAQKHSTTPLLPPSPHPHESIALAHRRCFLSGIFTYHMSIFQGSLRLLLRWVAQASQNRGGSLFWAWYYCCDPTVQPNFLLLRPPSARGTPPSEVFRGTPRAGERCPLLLALRSPAAYALYGPPHSHHALQGRSCTRCKGGHPCAQGRKSTRSRELLHAFRGRSFTRSKGGNPCAQGRKSMRSKELLHAFRGRSCTRSKL